MSLGELYDDLTDALTADATWNTGEGESQTFVIDSLEKADWAVRKIGQARRRYAEQKELARAEVERITEWAEAMAQRCEHDCSFFEELLARYHRDVLRDDPKAKTIRLPSGELVARKKPDSLVTDGGVDTLVWAREHDATIVHESVDKNTLKRLLAPSENVRPEGAEAVDKATGEVVPGVWFKTGETAFTVKTGDE